LPDDDTGGPGGGGIGLPEADNGGVAPGGGSRDASGSMTLAARSGTDGPSSWGTGSKLGWATTGSGSTTLLGGAEEPLEEITRFGAEVSGSGVGSGAGVGSGSSSGSIVGSGSCSDTGSGSDACVGSGVGSSDGLALAGLALAGLALAGLALAGLALAGLAFTSSGCTSRLRPSRSALRRARSA
jgi:hypothetical protein